jgi:hypothetical protein
MDQLSRDTENLERSARMELLWRRDDILQAVRDEIEGNESETEAMVAAYKQVSSILSCHPMEHADHVQKVIDVQWALAEQGPRVQELFSNPLARDAFSPRNMATMFGALDKDPTHIKAKILSDALRLERAQLEVRVGQAGGLEMESTKVVKELLELWGPRAAREYWDTVVGHPEEFLPVSEDQIARFGPLLK